jgi:hypothetical protein
MPSFLFSLDDIFESYVRNTFREALVVQKIAVLDGNKPQHHGRLFLDNNQYPTKPDLILRQKKLIVGLGEVKYKPGIEESDRYQVLSHVLAAGCKIGVWISPAAAGKHGGLEYVGSVSTGAKFCHYHLEIGGDLDIASAALAEKVTGLLPVYTRKLHPTRHREARLSGSRDRCSWEGVDPRTRPNSCGCHRQLCRTIARTQRVWSSGTNVAFAGSYRYFEIEPSLIRLTASSTACRGTRNHSRGLTGFPKRSFISRSTRAGEKNR